ncbi:MAG: 3-phosphoshikimate 1-carboxyvinyltransferase, partial [Treponema sp.]|nr:3-phosphoshikimate 1-carboxyvinyltransferase [Treponema sp.]
MKSESSGNEYVRIIPRRFSGVVRVPASKSHSIRQLFIASLADGVSEIFNPLDSLDTRSCVSACRAFGAEIAECRAVDNEGKNPNLPNEKGEKLVKWEIRGNNGFKQKAVIPNVQIDAGNSGTTLFFALAAAGLQLAPVIFTGDEQIQRRTAAPLLESLTGLGIQCVSRKGCVPITIKGPWKGGRVSLSCHTSQYLSSLLIASPLAPSGTVTEIEVPLLNERPYIEMTRSY